MIRNTPQLIINDSSLTQPLAHNSYDPRDNPVMLSGPFHHCELDKLIFSIKGSLGVRPQLYFYHLFFKENYPFSSANSVETDQTPYLAASDVRH